MPGGYDLQSRQMLDYWATVSGARDRVVGIRRHLRSLVAQGTTLDATRIRESRRRGLIMIHDYWRFIDKNRDSVAITGSLALLCFGLIRRKPGNLDLIRIGGIRETRVKSLTINTWSMNGQTIESSGGFLFQNPYEILLRKADTVSGTEGPDWKICHLDDILEASATLGID